MIFNWIFHFSILFCLIFKIKKNWYVFCVRVFDSVTLCGAHMCILIIQYAPPSPHIQSSSRFTSFTGCIPQVLTLLPSSTYVKSPYISSSFYFSLSYLYLSLFLFLFLFSFSPSLTHSIFLSSYITYYSNHFIYEYFFTIHVVIFKPHLK